jgi:hypothetical protein
MRLIPSDECARVYSGLGLSRAFARGGAMAGCGAGAGFSSERLDPRMVPGCVLMACTDTTAEPNAVVFPADVVVNGAFAADATWTKGANWTIPTPYALHAAGSTATLSQACVVVGNTYTFRLVVSNATAGTVTLSAGTTSGTARFNGDFTETLLCAGNTTLALAPTNDFDGRITLVASSPRNASRFTDLNGTGHHLDQATAANQPLFVASGAGGYLEFDGVADALYATYARNQPRTIVACFAPYARAAERYFMGGQGDATLVFHSAAAGSTMKIYSGATVGTDTYTDGAFSTWSAIFNGAASSIQKDSGAPVTGDAGATNATKMIVGAYSTAGSLAEHMKLISIAEYNRALNASEISRLIRWNTRLRARLAI